MLGFKPFQAKCPIFLNKQNKSYVLTWYDIDSDDSSDSNIDVKALVSNISLTLCHMRILILKHFKELKALHLKKIHLIHLTRCLINDKKT